MSETFFKAIRPDGASFHNKGFMWSTEPGGLTTHPKHGESGGGAENYLSVSTVVTDCTGCRWPARLLLVEPVGVVFKPDTNLPNKVAGRSFRTVKELDPLLLLGPQGRELVELFARAKDLHARDTPWDTVWGTARDDAWGDAWDSAWHSARDAAGFAARNAAWDAAWFAAVSPVGDAAGTLMIRDLINPSGFTQEHYDLLTTPWRKAVGPLHPDDQEVK